MQTPFVMRGSGVQVTLAAPFFSRTYRVLSLISPANWHATDTHLAYFAGVPSGSDSRTVRFGLTADTRFGLLGRRRLAHCGHSGHSNKLKIHHNAKVIGATPSIGCFRRTSNDARSFHIGTERNVVDRPIIDFVYDA